MRFSGVAFFPLSRLQALRLRLNVHTATLAVASALLLLAPMPKAFADVKRKLLDHPDPEYPAAAKHQGVQGAVILRIVIEPDGHVSDVRVASGDPLLVDAAKAAAKLWKYSPAGEQSVSVIQISFAK